MNWDGIFVRLAGTWILEIVASVFSLFCLLAVIVILDKADGKTIMVWHGITLNTIVSVLATASKLSALYMISSAISQTKWNLFTRGPRSLLEFDAIDGASRGALGCAQLLWRSRRIANVGIFAVLIAAAFEPFTQQLIQYKNEVLFTNNTEVTLPVSKRYDGGNSVVVQETGLDYPISGDGDRPLMEEVKYQADFNMQAAVLNGLGQNIATLPQQLPLNCPSGNCTWSPVESLAVCSTCKDIGSLLQKRTNATSDGGPGTALFESLSGNDMGLMFGNLTRFESPNGLWIDGMDGSSNLPLRMVAFGTGDPQNTTSMQTVDTLIWSMTMITADPNEHNTSATWPDVLLRASECALYYCVKTYNTNITNSKVQQNITETYTRRSPDSWQVLGGINHVEDAAPSEQQMRYAFDNATLDSLFVAKGMSISEMTEDYNTGFTGSLNHTDLILGDGYSLSRTAIMSTSYYFQTTFVHAVNETMNGDAMTLTGFYLDDESLQGEHQPPVMKPLFKGRNDLKTTFETIAESMSNAIRTSSSGEQDSGQGGRSVIKYRVQWPWIALPAVVVIASIIQLITTIMSSKCKPLWKSSTLATLSRGPFVVEVFDGVSTISELTHAAGKEDVDLFEQRMLQKDEASSTASPESDSLLTVISPRLKYRA